MSRKIFAVLLLSLTIPACDSSLTDNNSSGHSNTRTTADVTASPAPVTPAPQPSASGQQQFKAGDKVKVAIDGSSKDATVVKVDETLSKVTIKLEGQTEEKTVPMSDVSHRVTPN